MENNFFGKALVEGCAIAAPCRTKIAEQLLEIGVKAGITGVVAKEIADNLSPEELEHLVTLQMMGNDEITGKYLSSLQDKYAPSHTELPIADKDLTGGKLENPAPTENTATTLTTPDQSDKNVSSNTGNTDGAPSTAGNTTTTPIPDGPNKDDLAYLSEKPLGLGSTGRTQANSLQEKLAMEQALSNPDAGRQLPIPMTDKRWPKEEGWVKMAQNINGVEIHYVRNTKTNQIDDFKFK
ncbi:hypothetical protein MJO48_12495 [Dickeya fangzhongdai]|uniref:hypothetical protein n=1 Tax=Dickeya fangzhongdai TaxID=1778540 RepID=UPI001EFA4B5D|nr:hypothetical protein [Dickeya fangzhongdai]ULR29330.1 hypothetical protein MJO48_12495 [Dickeya fangzhongdai]